MFAYLCWETNYSVVLFKLIDFTFCGYNSTAAGGAAAGDFFRKAYVGCITKKKLVSSQKCTKIFFVEKFLRH
jgi:hypothetical protein